MLAATAIDDTRPVSAVAIGRNEGERLRRCLTSMQGRFQHVVYVDSGSTDHSLDIARDAGVEIVELDLAKPFTAARARNAGFAAIEAQGQVTDFVQFIDGDCVLESSWLAQGEAAMRADPRLGIVTGWRSEMYRNASIYNAICDFEWLRPAGEILACGGDMLVRSEALRAVGGFDDNVIAAEDDEFCIRIREQGWRVRRLPVEMTRHDAAMTRFSQWWHRAVRSGHGFAQVGDIHPRYFVQERIRICFFGLALPIAALLGSTFSLLAPLGISAIYAASYIRTARGLMREGLPVSEAWSHAVFVSLSKFPNLIGAHKYYWRRRHGRKLEIIEYK